MEYEIKWAHALFAVMSFFHIVFIFCSQIHCAVLAARCESLVVCRFEFVYLCNDNAVVVVVHICIV